MLNYSKTVLFTLFFNRFLKKDHILSLKVEIQQDPQFIIARKPQKIDTNLNYLKKTTRRTYNVNSMVVAWYHKLLKYCYCVKLKQNNNTAIKCAHFSFGCVNCVNGSTRPQTLD